MKVDLQAAGATAHLSQVEDVLASLGSDPDRGLDSASASERLSSLGPNTIVSEKRSSPLSLFLDQFKNALVAILIIAAVLSLLHWFYTREEALPFDFIIIAAIILLNAILGFVQEFRAEKAMEALKELSSPEARILRDGEVKMVPASEVVVGDVLLLEAGDKICADLRLISEVDVRSDESILTGESTTVRKRTEALDEDAGIADRTNMLFSGTIITNGRGKGIAAATGINTEIGKIAHFIAQEEKEETPLQKEMDKLGRQIGAIVLVIAAITITFALVAQDSFTISAILGIALFGIALAVAAIPEGLPAVVTISLALGVKRMAAKKAIVRRLAAVETLGSTNVICSDKTGTITENRLTVTDVVLCADVIDKQNRPSDQIAATVQNECLHEDPRTELLLAGVLCNNATELGSGADPVETALVQAAISAGVEVSSSLERYPRTAELPFNSENKYMLTVHERDELLFVVMKGAPEMVLPLCATANIDGVTVDLAPENAVKINTKTEELARKGLKTLAFATACIKKNTFGTHVTSENLIDKLEEGLLNGSFKLSLLGIMGLMDPPRPEVFGAIEKCKRAGIEVVMITGDHKATAITVAKDTGIFTEGDLALDGKELAALTEEEFEKIVSDVRVYARVEPAQKLRIVQALQAKGNIVAMTGDGVNDAPALNRADIGIAMGITGTDVSREASDMILTDDNFATIVSAIEEGRMIFANIRRFISFLFSTNSGEVLTLFLGVVLASMLGLVEGGHILVPLLAIHILWVNIITDGAPALALGVEPKDKDAMNGAPRRIGEPIIRQDMWRAVAIMGTVMAVGTLFMIDLYTTGGMIHTPDVNIEYARTMAFTVLVMFQLFDSLNWRSYPKSIFKVPLFGNKWLTMALAGSVLLQLMIMYVPGLAGAFEAVPLNVTDWVRIICAASLIIVAMELYKWRLRWETR